MVVVVSILFNIFFGSNWYFQAKYAGVDLPLGLARGARKVRILSKAIPNEGAFPFGCLRISENIIGNQDNDIGYT